MLDQRRRRWADVVQMLYKCFVFTGISVIQSHLTRHRCLSVGPTYADVGTALKQRLLFRVILYCIKSSLHIDRSVTTLATAEYT